MCTPDNVCVPTKRKPQGQATSKLKGRPRNPTRIEIAVGATDLTVAQAKDLFLMCLVRGDSVKDSIAAAGRAPRTLEHWKKTDPEFRAKYASIRERQGYRFRARGGVRASGETEALGLAELAGVEDPRALSFEQFSEHYLKQRVFPHMLNVVDLLDGREPRWLHPSMEFHRGEPDLVLINVPPEHAKSTTITMNYVTWRIAMDPDVKVLVVSKTQALAKKFLLGIRNRLTHPQYKDLIRDFAPVGGFDSDSDSWTAEMIYVAGRDVEQKDPTVQAIGIGGSIYGTRADLVIMDDCVDLKNAHKHSDQIDWIESEVMTRIESNMGKLLVIGTRLAARDLYGELSDPSRFTDGVSPWTVLRMPALLEADEDPRKWVTLWPYTNVRSRGLRAEDQTPDGLWPKWDGPRLRKRRARVKPVIWSRVYQQQQQAEDTVFDPADVKGCTNGRRNVGRIPANTPYNRTLGMDGLVVVAGLDPATTGHTAATVVGLDLPTRRRYVLDVRNRARMHPDQMREMIYELTDRYQIVEWVIEKNGFQGFLAQDREVNAYLSSRGCIVRPHFTGDNKRDPDFGVAAMSGLFKGWQNGENLIELPSAHMSEGVKAMIEQLVTWAPGMAKSQKQDVVMSLWMAELACLRRLDALSAFGRQHMRSQFLSSYDKSRQVVVNVATAAGWKAVGV